MQDETTESCEDCENTCHLYIKVYGACGCPCHRDKKEE